MILRKPTMEVAAQAELSIAGDGDIEKGNLLKKRAATAAEFFLLNFIIPIYILLFACLTFFGESN